MTDGVKKLLLAIVPTLLLLVVAEVGIRLVYFQRFADHPTALHFGVSHAQNLVDRWQAEREFRRTVRQLGLSSGETLIPEYVRKRLHRALYAPENRELLLQFHAEYAAAFARLVDAVQSAKTRLLVIYLPSDNYETGTLYRRDSCREFYRTLTATHGVEFLDLTDVFLKYPVTQVTLLPENGHLSRFGNQLVVEHLRPYLDVHPEVRPGVAQKDPGRLGDLTPDQREVCLISPDMPYRVISNRQGLRMDYELAFPKEKQRVLVLGDSYTYGPYLDNHDCYPNLLDREYQDREIINAGVAGYTIHDEVGLFCGRAVQCEPDITILQVLDNDLYDLFYFQKNEYARDRRRYAPTPAEVRFIERVKQRADMETGQ